jgi:hypothetical protein
VPLALQVRLALQQILQWVVQKAVAQHRQLELAYQQL